MACEGDAEDRLEAGRTPRMPLPVPWPAGCGGRSVRAALTAPVSVFPLSALPFSALATIAFELSGTSARAAMALVTGGAGWAGPAAANLVWPALIWTVFTLTGFIGSDEPGIAAIAWAWMTPLVSGAGSGFAADLTDDASGLACDISDTAAAGRDGAGTIETGADWTGCAASGVGATSSASATSTLESDGLRSVIAATVRLVEAFSRFSARRLRMMASREPPLRPPMTTPTRWRLPRRIDVTRLKPDARV